MRVSITLACGGATRKLPNPKIECQQLYPVVFDRAIQVAA